MFIGGLLFILGLCVGSFLNSFLWRYSEKKTFKGRSMCPMCEHKIAWYDNVPVVSWFVLSGKCRNCKKTISVQYPTVELLTGVLFGLVGSFTYQGKLLESAIREISNEIIISHSVILFLMLVVTGFLVMISVYDYKTKEIPNGFNGLFVSLSVIYLVVNTALTKAPLQSLIFPALTALFIFSIFYSLVYFSKETWMGGGDAKFVIGMGLLLGPAGTFLAVLLASVIGSIYGLLVIGLGRISFKKSKLKKFFNYKNVSLTHEIPFGPFLALGTFVALVFGPNIIDFYVKIVLGL